MGRKIVIMGAAGRDFHDFNTYYRDNPEFEVVAFTATQIPNIENRTYPPHLAGRLYPGGIPIYPESKLPELIRGKAVQEVVFAYSDIPHEEVMHKASIVLSNEADFTLLGNRSIRLRSTKPVVSVLAVRTGSGKSQTTRRVAAIFKEMGKKVAVIRHPMPYGDLLAEEVERFETYDDLDRYHTTIEEREEYEPHIDSGTVVFAGVDYEKILREAEKEADIIIWDGGNNDFSFYHSDLEIVVADPFRPGHELLYHPGEVNFRSADVIIINKVDTARKEDVEKVRKNAELVNSSATVIECASPISMDDGIELKGKRVIAIDDGPTLTHGGMKYGAGYIAAQRAGAVIVDPRPYAVESIRDVYRRFTHLSNVLPAMGYSEKQIMDLQETINRADCDAVVTGTPIDIRRLIKTTKPIVHCRYELSELTKPGLKEILAEFWDER